MANKTVYLSGVAYWTKVHDPDTRFNAEGVYSLDFYPDEESLSIFGSLGLGLKERSDENGVFYKLKRPHAGMKYGEPFVFGRPRVFDKDGAPFEGKVGNGSVVTVKLEIYDTRKGPAHRLEAIRVEDLVPYEDNTIKGDDVIPF